MNDLPFSVRIQLEGWQLFWALLTVDRTTQGELDEARTRTAAAVRSRFSDTAAISSHPPVAAMRRLFRDAGCDPTRYRPSSEALLRRLVKGDGLPAIHPLVDLNNCLSAALAVPCCVMFDGSFGISLTFRAGVPGESYESLRGPFNLDSKPVLCDEDGPLDTPITGNVRVKVGPETIRAWLVAYLPHGVVSPDDCWSMVQQLAPSAGVSAERYPAT